MLFFKEQINMLGIWFLRRHAKKSKEKLRDYLSIDDFAILLSEYDGYAKSLPRWVWWF